MKQSSMLVMLLMVGAFLTLACSGPKSKPQSVAAGVPSIQAPAITASELRDVLHQPHVTVIDVRIETDWSSSGSKIPGSIRRDPNNVQAWIDGLDKSKLVVTY